MIAIKKKNHSDLYVLVSINKIYLKYALSFIHSFKFEEEDNTIPDQKNQNTAKPISLCGENDIPAKANICEKSCIEAKKAHIYFCAWY